MDKVKKKIAIVLSTGNLENDDRIRKEAICLKDNGYQVKIFAQLPDNKEESGYTSYGIEYKLLYLKTREIFTSGTFLLSKTLEMYFKIVKHLKEYDIIWCADEGTFLYPLLLKSKSVIWDLHEIPQMFLKNGLTKFFLKHLEKKCRLVIHANQYRLDHLVSNNAISDINKNICIRNYPDRSFVNSNLLPDFYTDMKKWLDGSNYVYLQGISASTRYPYNSIASILKSTDLKVIITANMIKDDVKAKLISEFGNSFYERVYFAGMLDQLYTPSIIRDAYFSMVFYQTCSANNRYCEANRFYQPLVFGVPVICGFNEPLYDIIQEYKCGISLKSDGEDLNEIMSAIKTLTEDYNLYKEKAIAVKNNFIWTNDYFMNSVQGFL